MNVKFLIFLVLCSTFCGKEKILICGICRDVENALPNMKKNVERLGGVFDDYRVVIYENNSRDRTAQMLENWAVENPKVCFKSECLEELSLVRTVDIANARNRLLDLIQSLDLQKEYKILVMSDFDFLCPWPIDEMVQSIHDDRDWDAICANGVYSMSDPFYWDRYAFRSIEYPYGPEIIGDSWWWEDVNHRVYFDGDDFVAVFSAFGGFAIYKTEAILKCRYSGVVIDELKMFYREILGADVPLIRNTYWEHPADPEVVTCCEHVSLYASMMLHGFDKIFINPRMIIYYHESI